MADADLIIVLVFVFIENATATMCDLFGRLQFGATLKIGGENFRDWSSLKVLPLPYWQKWNLQQEIKCLLFSHSPSLYFSFILLNPNILDF